MAESITVAVTIQLEPGETAEKETERFLDDVRIALTQSQYFSLSRSERLVGLVATSTHIPSHVHRHAIRVPKRP